MLQFYLGENYGKVHLTFYFTFLLCSQFALTGGTIIEDGQSDKCPEFWSLGFQRRSCGLVILLPNINFQCK